MAITYSYPTATPEEQDLLVGTEMAVQGGEDAPRTRTFTIGSIIGLLTPALNLKANIESPTFTGTVGGITKAMVGLSNVDNTTDESKPISTATQTALNSKVATNTAVTAGTKTKISYDAKGLVTNGVDATTADINDSTNRRYVTDAQQTAIGSISGVNTGDQNLQTVTNKGAITTLGIGAAFFTITGGLGTQFLKANGTVDETAYRKTVVKDTTLNAGGGATSPVLVSACLVPANSFALGDYINFRTYLSKTNTNGGGSLTVSINNVDSLTGSLQVATYEFSNTLVDVSLSREWFVDGSNMRGYYNSASSIDGIGPIETTYISSGATFAPSTLIWFLVSVRFDSASDGYLHRGTTITN